MKTDIHPDYQAVVFRDLGLFGLVGQDTYLRSPTLVKVSLSIRMAEQPIDRSLHVTSGFF